MDYILTTKKTCQYVECIPDGDLIDSEAKALDLVGACGELQNSKLLIHASSFPDEFYDLKTGLAGGVMLKFSNYGIMAALVIPQEKIGEGRFYEMMLETNRGNQFRIFQTLEDAENWFAKLT